MDIDNILVSNKISSGEKSCKYFIVYVDGSHKIKPLRKMLPKASTYVKSYDGGTKWMYFLIDDDQLLKKYNDIWNKVSKSIKQI